MVHGRVHDMGINPQYLKQLLAQRGARLEISEPFRVGRSDRYMCIGKIVGVPARILGLGSLDEPPEEPPEEETQTMCVFSEFGDSPAAAQQRLLKRVATVRQLPTVPPRTAPRRGWLGRMISAFAHGKNGSSR